VLHQGKIPYPVGILDLLKHHKMEWGGKDILGKSGLFLDVLLLGR
jgi:hypothetical protein